MQITKRRTLLNDKKGDISDGLTLIVILFFLAVSMLMAMFAVTKMRDVITKTDLNSTDYAKDAVRGMDNITDGAVNKLYGFMAGMLIISLIISAFLVYVHPAFIALYIILFAMILFIVPPLANTYQLIYQNPTFSALAVQQTTFTFIMKNLGLITLGSIGLSLIVLFGKLFTGGNRQDGV